MISSSRGWPRCARSWRRRARRCRRHASSARASSTSDGLAHERHGEVVHVQRRRELDVLAVLVGERLRRQAAAAPVDALVVGELAAGQHPALDPARPRRRPRAARSGRRRGSARRRAPRRSRGPGRSCRRPGRCRRAAPIAGSSANGSPSASTARPSAKRSMRIFGPCRSPSTRDVLADGRGRAAHAVHALAVILGRAVREIDAHDVRAAADDVLEHARRVGGRAQGGDDLGSAKHRKRS